MQGKDPSSAAHPTIFHELLRSDLPPEEISLPRLIGEAQVVVAAGQVTTAHYLRTTTYHILANPDIHRKLKAELLEAIPNPDQMPFLPALEHLPFLSAVVTEGFRITYGVVHRLQRIPTHEPLRFQEWTIPVGTPVGMTSVFMHDNPINFPNPHEFRPERWLDRADRSRLERYLVNFSKGTRACLGMNLAHAEIYITLAAVFRRFDLELYETKREDVDFVHDNFNPASRKGSKGVRIVVK